VGIIEFGGKTVSRGSGANSVNILKFRVYFGQVPVFYLSTSLISVECERVFLSAKNLITDRRNGLKEDIIQACTLLRYRLKEAGFK